ncbi:MAG: thymidine phosphorylase, partial [Cyclobacteriaceae bacterium]
GGFKEPVLASHKKDILCKRQGKVVAIDTRRLAKLAKLAGAPSDPAAGVLFQAFLGTEVQKGDILFTVFAQSPGELQYALNYFKDEPEIIEIDD